MNNEQFRRLVSGNTPKPPTDKNGASPTPPKAMALGSRQKSSIPMTPRSVAGLNTKSEFARQLAERNQTNKQQKTFRSYAPKGSKLAEGYTDRTQSRVSDSDDERFARIKALEESLKNEEIDQETFDKIRSQIAGGDLSSTHLVKGLDFKLLERIRKGEDVYGDSKTEEEEPEEEPKDVDDEFDRLEEEKIAAVEKEKTAKKGQLSTAPLNPSRKRTRDQILAEMKAAREAAKAKEESTLGSKFKKIGPKTPGTRIERDSKGREVMIIVDEDGTEKRKVRKVRTSSSAESESKATDLMMPDPKAKPLGMEVPEIYRSKMEEPEDEDVDIFDGVGDDYDPLAGLAEDSDESESEDKTKQADTSKQDKDAMPPPPRPAAPSEPRNYFKDSKTGLASSETLQAPSMSDPAIQAAFKKAASLKIASLNTMADEDDDEEARAKAERRRKMLQNDDRDAEDMDMGFGTSRFEDEADFEEQKVKLSEWGKEGDEDQKGRGGGNSKRKRGPKKRKGDGNNAADVLRIMEQRRAAG
ncbi:hypothetical protein F4775DRAFT_543590 [Biscogniauxia sp. FL1348]|nr:hypothetical protein F4775DRAFT_543590 [Biscogniauxia sp. FL1348]